MTQKVDPRKIKVPDSSEGFILRVPPEGESEFFDVVSGAGTLDSAQMISNFETFLGNLNLDFQSLTGCNSIGSPERRFNQLFLSDSIYLGASCIVEDGLFYVNSIPVTKIDSSNVLNTVDSDYVRQRAPNIDVQGVQGVRGYRGTLGLQGLDGRCIGLGCPQETIQGLQGIQGFAGAPREQVLQGVQGVQGIDGFSGGGLGLQGPQGTLGLSGVRGERGDKGTQGIQGFSGGDNIQGVQGTQGPVGPQGVPGANGAPGPQGLQGLQGFQGTVQGVQGFQGIQGVTNTVRGAQGIQGPRGFDGTVSGPGDIQGIQGLRGTASDIQGIQGLTGIGGAETPYCINVICNMCCTGNNGFYITNCGSAFNCLGRSTNSITIGHQIGLTASVSQTLRIGVNAGDAFIPQCRSFIIGAFADDASCGRSSVLSNVTIGYNAEGGQSGDVVIGACNCTVGTNCRICNNVRIGGNNCFHDLCSFENVQIGHSVVSGDTTSTYIGSYTNGCSLNARGEKNVVLGSARFGVCPSNGSIENTHIGPNSFCGSSTLSRPRIESTIRNTSIGAGAMSISVANCPLISRYWCNTAIGALSASLLQMPSSSIPCVQNLTYIGSRGSVAPALFNTVYLGPSSTSAIRANVTTISALSDCRDKKNIEDIPYGLDFINEMKPVCFTWNSRDSDGVRDLTDIGFIAQDLQELEENQQSTKWTRLVSGTEDRLEADPFRTYPIAIKAIQELKKQINRLKDDFQSLKDAT